MLTKKTDFLTFNDGLLQIDGEFYRYGERTVSMNRHYAARTAGTQADRVVHIPYTTDITADSRVLINDCIYRAELVQPTKATHPFCTILTLRRFGVRTDDYD